MTADVLSLLPEGSEAAQLAAIGLVGEGAAIEYLTWRREADLPDPAMVVADPQSVRWASLDSSLYGGAYTRAFVAMIQDMHKAFGLNLPG